MADGLKTREPALSQPWWLTWLDGLIDKFRHDGSGREKNDGVYRV